MKILNCAAVLETEKNMVFAARLTQRGHRIASMADLERLYERPYTGTALKTIAALPHPTVQKLEVITVAIVGASRRFLAQITRHQNEVKFMSASLQYSDYSKSAEFAMPYEIMTAREEIREKYRQACCTVLSEYEQLCKAGIGHDSAGYLTPQGLRNVLIISATPYQWKHMIGQRVCRRNTDETRLVMLMIWQELYRLSPILFASELTGPFCQRGQCAEGKMSCGQPIQREMPPLDILLADYPLLRKEAAVENQAD